MLENILFHRAVGSFPLIALENMYSKISTISNTLICRFVSLASSCVCAIFKPLIWFSISSTTNRRSLCSLSLAESRLYFGMKKLWISFGRTPCKTRSRVWIILWDKRSFSQRWPGVENNCDTRTVLNIYDGTKDASSQGRIQEFLKGGVVHYQWMSPVHVACYTWTWYDLCEMYIIFS